MMSLKVFLTAMLLTAIFFAGYATTDNQLAKRWLYRLVNVGLLVMLGSLFAGIWA